VDWLKYMVRFPLFDLPPVNFPGLVHPMVWAKPLYRGIMALRVRTFSAAGIPGNWENIGIERPLIGSSG
jgi:hypothetical protein